MNRKVLVTPLTGCIAALLFVLLIPAAYAKPPATASGIWEFTPSITGMRFADGNTFIEATSVDKWTGIIEGEGGSVESVVVHKLGFWYARGILTLDPCTVGVESGTLVILYVGKGTPAGDWSGQWTILSGTDDLANLHGQGTWWGPDSNGDFPYSGKIHFDP